jgi:hypothetical protein
MGFAAEVLPCGMRGILGNQVTLRKSPVEYSSLDSSSAILLLATQRVPACLSRRRDRGSSEVGSPPDTCQLQHSRRSLFAGGAMRKAEQDGSDGSEESEKVEEAWSQQARLGPRSGRL